MLSNGWTQFLLETGFISHVLLGDACVSNSFCSNSLIIRMEASSSRASFSWASHSLHLLQTVTSLLRLLFAEIWAWVSRIQHNKHLPTFWHQNVNRSVSWSVLPCFRLYTIDKIPKLSNPDNNLLSSDPFKMCLSNNIYLLQLGCYLVAGVNLRVYKIWNLLKKNEICY